MRHFTNIEERVTALEDDGTDPELKDGELESRLMETARYYGVYAEFAEAWEKFSRALEDSGGDADAAVAVLSTEEVEVVVRVWWPTWDKIRQGTDPGD